MTESLLISIPVLGRPDRAGPVAASALAATPDARILFLCSPGDDDEIAACRATDAEVEVVDWRPGPGDYARKHNHAYRNAPETWTFLGADDLNFVPGWFEACLRRHFHTKACVIGTNDLGNTRVMRGHHSTHTLVHRDYLECGTVDGDGLILYEGYGHQFVDDEFIGTAQARGTFAMAGDARVEHLHPNWKKGVWDPTYEKGQASFDNDRRIFNLRSPMWLPQPSRDRRRG